MVQRALAVAGPHDFVRFKVVGPLDDSAAARLRSRLLHAVEDGCRRLSLDCEYVPCVDTAGLKVLVELASQPGEPVEIELVGANRAVSEAFSQTRLSDCFPISVRS